MGKCSVIEDEDVGKGSDKEVDYQTEKPAMVSQTIHGAGNALTQTML